MAQERRHRGLGLALFIVGTVSFLATVAWVSLHPSSGHGSVSYLVAAIFVASTFAATAGFLLFRQK